jgi:WD40 repeat protein
MAAARAHDGDPGGARDAVSDIEEDMPSLSLLLPPAPEPPAPLAVHALHTALIHALVPLDEDRVVSAGEDSVLLVASLRDGTVIQHLEGHAGPVNTLVRTPHGKWLVTGGDDSDVRVWDARTLKCRRVLSGHTAYVRQVAASDRRILSGAEDSTLRVWSLDKGTCERVLEHPEHLRAVAITPDGKRGAASSLDGALWIWDLDSGEIVHKLSPGGGHVARVQGASLYMAFIPEGTPGHRDAPSALQFSADGRRLVSVEHEVIVWDLEKGTEIFRLPRQGWPFGAALLLPDGRIALGGHSIQIWDLETRRRVGLLDVGGEPHVALALTPDGKRLCSGTREGKLMVWPLDRAQGTGAAQASPVTDLRLAPPHVAGLASDGSVYLWHEGEGLVLPIEEHNEANGKPFRFSADGRTLVTLSEKNGIFVWDVPGRALRKKLPPIEHEDRRVSPHGLALLPRNRALVGALGEGLFEIDLTGGKPPRAFKGRGEQIDDITVAPDGRTAFTQGYFATDPKKDDFGSSVSQLQAWDLKKRALLWTLPAKKPRGEDFALHYGFIAVAPQGDVLVTHSGSRKGALAVYAAASGELLRHVRIPDGADTEHPRFVTDTTLVVLARPENGPPSVLRIDVAKGKIRERVELPVQQTHWTHMNAGASVVACAIEQQVQVFEAASGKLLGQYAAGAQIRSVALSPDGKRLAVGDFEGRTHLLRVER